MKDVQKEKDPLPCGCEQVACPGICRNSTMMASCQCNFLDLSNRESLTGDTS